MNTAPGVLEIDWSAVQAGNLTISRSEGSLARISNATTCTRRLKEI